MLPPSSRDFLTRDPPLTWRAQRTPHKMFLRSILSPQVLRAVRAAPATPAAAPLSTSAPSLGLTTGGGSDAAAPPILPKQQMQDFMSVFPDLVRDIAFDEAYKDFPRGTVDRHLTRCIQYTVPKGKKNRGLTVPASLRILRPDLASDREAMREACVLGWCVEFLQAYLLVADDLMDGSETRRGQACWHKVDGVGLAAFNDAIILEQSVYVFLKKYFSEKPYYLHLVDEFRAVNRHTAVGQALDLLSAQLRTEDGRVDVDAFDMKRYNAIVLHKTSYYSIYLPVVLAMRAAGIEGAESYHRARNILLQMGKLFQVQDDYLDVFGDPTTTGKVGTDIQDGKCSWVIVVAMQRANKEHKEILREHYGRGQEESVAKVKAVFDELKIKKVYKQYEETTYSGIMEMIQQTPGEGKILPPKVFTAFLDRIYKRDY